MESEVSPAMKGSDGKGACLSQAGQLLCVVGIISWSVQQDVLKKGKVPFGEFIETAWPWAETSPAGFISPICILA